MLNVIKPRLRYYTRDIIPPRTNPNLFLLGFTSKSGTAVWRHQCTRRKCCLLTGIAHWHVRLFLRSTRLRDLAACSPKYTVAPSRCLHNLPEQIRCRDLCLDIILRRPQCHLLLVSFASNPPPTDRFISLTWAPMLSSRHPREHMSWPTRLWMTF